MRKRLQLAGVVGVLALLGVVGGAVATGGHRDIRETLTGYEETPATISSTGSADFRARIDRWDDKIHYKLSYRDLESAVTQAHIHFGARATSGGISVWLCGNNPPITNTPAGVQPCPAAPATISGTIGPEHVVGPTGQGIEVGAFDELTDAIRAGVTYANVHTVGRPTRRDPRSAGRRRRRPRPLVGRHLSRASARGRPGAGRSALLTRGRGCACPRGAPGVTSAHEERDNRAGGSARARARSRPRLPPAPVGVADPADTSYGAPDVLALAADSDATGTLSVVTRFAPRPPAGWGLCVPFVPGSPSCFPLDMRVDWFLDAVPGAGSLADEGADARVTAVPTRGQSVMELARFDVTRGWVTGPVPGLTQTGGSPTLDLGWQAAFASLGIAPGSAVAIRVVSRYRTFTGLGTPLVYEDRAPDAGGLQVTLAGVPAASGPAA